MPRRASARGLSASTSAGTATRSAVTQSQRRIPFGHADRGRREYQHDRVQPHRSRRQDQHDGDAGQHWSQSDRDRKCPSTATRSWRRRGSTAASTSMSARTRRRSRRTTSERTTPARLALRRTRPVSSTSERTRRSAGPGAMATSLPEVITASAQGDPAPSFRATSSGRTFPETRSGTPTRASRSAGRTF